MAEAILYDEDNICLCDIPTTFSLPVPAGSYRKQAIARQRHWLSLCDRGVLEGRLRISSSGLAFITSNASRVARSKQLTYDDPCVLKIALKNIVELSCSDGGGLAVYFREITLIPLKYVGNGELRATRNYQKLIGEVKEIAVKEEIDGGPKKASDTESEWRCFCLFRLADSAQWSKSESQQLITQLFNARSDTELLRKVTKSHQDASVQSVLKRKLPPKTTVPDPREYLYARILDPLRPSDGVVLLNPVGYLFVHLPSGRVDTYLLRRCAFALERVVSCEVRGCEVFYAPATNTSREITSLYIVFESAAHHRVFVDHLSSADPKMFAPQRDHHFIKQLTNLWQNGKLSNFHYLQALNCIAGRSERSLPAYPVFPWITARWSALFNSAVLLDLGNESQTKCSSPKRDRPVARPESAKQTANYRDLSRPIGALSHERLERLLERMYELPRKDQYLFGSHYSTPAFVAHWRLRHAPELHLKMNAGKFDHKTRLFHSIVDSWTAVLKGQTSFMELTPEFFRADPTFLLCEMDLDAEVEDVELPPGCFCPFRTDEVVQAAGASSLTWSGQLMKSLTARELNALWFLFLHRLVLEGGVVSTRLHKWIDLIFGYRQLGEAAEEAFNIFHPTTYLTRETGQGLIPRSNPPKPSVNSCPKSEPDKAVLQQIDEFGQAPLQLFFESHPPRRTHPTGLLMSGVGATPIPVGEILRQFVEFIGDSRESATGQMTASCSWLTIFQSQPALLPFPGVVKRLEASGAATSGPERILTRGAPGLKSNKDRVVTWVGGASSPLLTHYLSGRVGMPADAFAFHDNRMASLDSKNGLLAIHRLTDAVDDPSRCHLLSNTGLTPCVTFDASGGHVFAGTRGGKIVGINVTASVQLERITFSRAAHRGKILCISEASEMPHHLVTGSMDEAVGLWDSSNLSILSWWEGHQAPIVSVSAHSDHLLSSSVDGLVLQRDTRAPPWTVPIWQQQLHNGYIARNLKITGGVMQFVLHSVLAATTAPRTVNFSSNNMEGQPLTRSLWGNLAKVAKYPSDELRQRLAAHNGKWNTPPAVVVTFDRRMAATSAVCHLRVAPAAHQSNVVYKDLACTSLVDKALDEPPGYESVPVSVTLEGTSYGLILYKAKNASGGLLRVVDLMSGQETSRRLVPRVNSHSVVSAYPQAFSCRVVESFHPAASLACLSQPEISPLSPCLCVVTPELNDAHVDCWI